MEDRSNNRGTGIRGVRIDPKTGEPMDTPEEENYYICGDCGQAVDKRMLGEVLHHEDAGHVPLSTS